MRCEMDPIQEQLREDFIWFVDKLQKAFSEFLDELELLRSRARVEDPTKLNMSLFRVLFDLSRRVHDLSSQAERKAKLRIAQAVRKALEEARNNEGRADR